MSAVASLFNTDRVAGGWRARVGLKTGTRMAYDHAPFRLCD